MIVVIKYRWRREKENNCDFTRRVLAEQFEGCSSVTITVNGLVRELDQLENLPDDCVIVLQ